MSRLRKVTNTLLISLALVASAYQINQSLISLRETKAREKRINEMRAFRERIRERFGDAALECPTLGARMYYANPGIPGYRYAGIDSASGLPRLEYIRLEQNKEEK